MAYRVPQLKTPEEPLVFSVPASKSLLARALVLSALTSGKTVLECGDFGEDGRDLLRCLTSLGCRVERTDAGLAVLGTLSHEGYVNVGSAGTAARFLTAALAFRGGNYLFDSSEQMMRRPMSLLSVLETAGVSFEYLGEAGHFPFRMQSNGIKTDFLEVATDESTQYASGILLAAAAGSRPFTLRLCGCRTGGSYIEATKKVCEAFGATVERRGNDIFVTPTACPPSRYSVEPDLSGACYFYALTLLSGAAVLVRGVHSASSQPDLKFLDLLKARGVKLTETPDGILADGRAVHSFSGFDETLTDFSDQTLTLAALAPFADTPTILRGVGHIRRQECDRLAAAVENLTALGVPAFATEDKLFVQPSTVGNGTIGTHGDHRVAMAFSLIGLKTGGIVIDDPACCAKTFDGFFSILDGLPRA